MRILMLCPAYSIHSVKWANALAERGHEIHIAFCKGQEDSAGLLCASIIQHKLPIPAPLGYYLNFLVLKKLINFVEFDIIHAHRASSYGTLIRMSKSRCDILSIWGSDVYEFPYKSKIHRSIIEKNLSYTRCIASTSFVMAEQAKQFLESENIQILVTPFGVDLKKFSVDSRIKNNNRFIIGTIKTLSYKYCIDDAIDSFKLLLDKLNRRGYQEIANNIEYWIYGKGPMKGVLQQKIDDLELCDKVKLLGYIQNPEVPLKLKQFDIFLVTSQEESFGVAAVEAMACSLPVVATKAPGFCEVVSDGKTGLLCGIHAVEEIAESLLMLIIDQDKRIQMGLNGRQRVIDLYNWSNNVSTMESVYKNKAIQR